MCELEANKNRRTLQMFWQNMEQKARITCRKNLKSTNNFINSHMLLYIILRVLWRIIMHYGAY